MHTFSKMGTPEISRNVYFFRNKSPHGSFIDIGELFRTYPWWINSFLLWSQKLTFTHFRFFGNVLRYQVTFLPNTKMVRVVHMNIFYRMDLQFCDSNNELLRNTENSDFRKIEKNICVGAQNWLLRLFPSPEWFLNIFYPIPESSQLNVHIK